MRLNNGFNSKLHTTAFSTKESRTKRPRSRHFFSRTPRNKKSMPMAIQSIPLFAREVTKIIIRSKSGCAKKSFSQSKNCPSNSKSRSIRTPPSFFLSSYHIFSPAVNKIRTKEKAEGKSLGSSEYAMSIHLYSFILTQFYKYSPCGTLRPPQRK